MAAHRIPRSLRVALAFTLGVALWIVGAGVWHQALGSVVRATLPGEGAGGLLILADRNELLIGPVEFPAARGRVPMAVVTSNFALLLGLWGWDARGFRGRGLARLALAIALLGLIHFLAVLAGIHSTLAVQLSRWTGERYGTLETNLWFVFWQGYQIIGAWAAAFVLWWSLRRAPSDQASR
ncbi:MAG: hypothetical protein ABR517_06265 [Thermoanaerobaculia bacterium]